MNRRSPVRKILAFYAVLVAAATAHHALAASVMLPTGEPDPNCPDLRLWLRADSGILDAEGHASDSPDFSGKVAVWNDRSPCKFNLGASPEQTPLLVERQPAAGNRPTVAFSGAQVLKRSNAMLNDRPASTVILVVRGQRTNQCIYSIGKRISRESLRLNCGDGSLSSVGGSFMTTAGERGYDLRLGLPNDGTSGTRFAAILSNGDFDRRSLEYHDGLGDRLGPERPTFLAPMASDKCTPDFYLGGDETEFFCGQIAEMIVFNRGLSSAERRDMLKYLRQRYELDRTDGLFPPGTFLSLSDYFDGNWTWSATHPGQFCFRDRRVAAEGPPADEGITSTIDIPRNGHQHVWVRANENGFNARGPGGTTLRTIIQGKELNITHLRGPGGQAWREAGEVELGAGPAEIVIRGEGPGPKDCDMALVSPTADTEDAVNEICALANRIRSVSAESRLTAVFENGLRLDGSLLTGWRMMDLAGKAVRGEAAAMPALVCLQFDSRTEKSAAEFDSIIELQNGDRLRGAISGYTPGSTKDGKQTPAHVLIRPAQGFFEKRDYSFVVDTDWVRRIVFEASPRDRRCPPQTLICRNGRAYAFRAIRWNEQALSLLTDDGVERIALSEVAEVRMPTVDAWDRYYRELAVIDPEVKGGIVRVETVEGMAMTASTLRTSQVCAPRETLARVRLMHPVWSREPFPVPWANTRLLWRAPATVVPLSRFTPERVTQRGALGSSWKWQTDRNVVGGTLQNGGLEYLWGFGVHAPCEMVFQLPDCAKVFRSSVGIDSAVGGSGCVIAKIHLNQTTGTPLYESKRLIGSDAAVSTGEVALPAVPGGKRQLVLVTESAGDLRGEKGDPLDIGTHADWLEPVLLLDPALLRAEVAKRVVPE